MITGFEKETHELTDHELTVLLPMMVQVLEKRVGEKNAITSTQLLKGFKGCGKKTSAPRIRKMINHIRIHGLIFNLVSSSKGYYRPTDQQDCERYLESLKQRINSITAIHDALEWQLNQTIKQKNQP